jgi:hypothetical protein
VFPAAWSITSAGIYFLVREREHDALELLNPSTGKRTRVGLMPFKVSNHCGFLSVSPDASALISNHVDRFDSDLMLAEISH